MTDSYNIISMEGLSDLQGKYNKIASEYSKLRSQVPVLKKAVTDEQARCSELKEMLRIKDQRLRIAEGEIDGLNFRNQQLTCRVGILLKELEKSRNPHKKSGKIQEIQENSATFGEEFSKKIVENAELISTLQEYKERHKKEVHELMNQIKVLQQEIQNSIKKDKKELLVEAKLESIGGNTAITESTGPSEQFTEDVNLQNKGGFEDSIRNSNEHLNPFDENLFEQNKSLEHHNIKEDKKIWEPQENTVRWAIQKALEQQLLETQQLLQKTKNDYDHLNSNVKDLENKCKELEEKCAGLSSKEIASAVKGSINYIPNEEAQAREREIKRCYQHRIDLISSDSQHVKSKLLTFEKEVAVMKMRLETETNSYNEISKQLEMEKINLQKVKDELSTTVDNYNAQLSAMSDHVAQQNDSIQKQKDTIETLQYQLDKVSKRGKK